MEEWKVAIILSSLLLIGALTLAIFLSACSHSPYTASALAKEQQAIQECILSGGHAHLGPNNSIICGN